MIWWGIGVYLLIIVFILPIKIQSKFDYSVYNNKGNIKLFLWKIKLLDDDCFFRGSVLTLNNGKKESRVNINQYGEQNFFDRFINYLSKMIKINEIKTDFYVGVKDNPSVACMLAGFVLCVETALFGVLSTYKKIRVSRLVANPTNLENELGVKFSLGLTVCLLQIVVSILYAFFYKVKGVSYGKQSNKRNS